MVYGVRVRARARIRVRVRARAGVRARLQHIPVSRVPANNDRT